MTPLRDDLEQQLRKRPMTAKELSVCVSTTAPIARAALDAMCKAGKVRRRGFSNEKRPQFLFELVPSCQSQNAQGDGA